MRLFLVLLAVIAFAAPGSSRQVHRAASGSEADGPAAELKALIPIKLETLDGQPVAPDALKGSVIVLDFWATWCGPCIHEIPAYNRLQEKYADKGVKVIGVTLASGDAGDVKPFITRHNMKYTILMGDDAQAYDLNLVGFPTTYLVTRDWKIYRKYIGVTPNKSSQLDADIQKLLGTKPQ